MSIRSPESWALDSWVSGSRSQCPDKSSLIALIGSSCIMVTCHFHMTAYMVWNTILHASSSCLMWSTSLLPYSVSLFLTALMLKNTKAGKKTTRKTFCSSVKSRLGKRSPIAANCLEKVYFSCGVLLLPAPRVEMVVRKLAAVIWGRLWKQRDRRGRIGEGGEDAFRTGAGSP